MIETRECGCRTVWDKGGNVVSVGTCSQCLPVGAITWLIENGRQLELLEEERVTVGDRGRAELEAQALSSKNAPQVSPEGLLPF